MPLDRRAAAGSACGHRAARPRRRPCRPHGRRDRPLPRPRARSFGRDAPPALHARPVFSRRLHRVGGAKPPASGRARRRGRPARADPDGARRNALEAGARRRGVGVQSLRRPLGRAARRRRRGTSARAGRETGGRRRRAPGLRLESRGDRRAGRGRRARGAVRPPPGRERLPRPGPDPDRPPRKLLGTPGRAHDQPAAPRVSLSRRVRDGPSHRRLRGAEGAGGRGVVPARVGRGAPGGRDRLRRRGPGRLVRGRGRTPDRRRGGLRLLRPPRRSLAGADLPQRLVAPD